MRPGIQALESRLATLQQRANSGQYGGARMDRIQNRIGRLQDMGATGMRAPQNVAAGLGRGLMSGMGGQPQQQPMPSAPAFQDRMARFPAGQPLPQSPATSGQFAQTMAPDPAAMTGQPPMRSSVLNGGKFLQPGPAAPDFKQFANIFANRG